MEERKTPEHNRLVNLCIPTKADIITKKELVQAILNQDPSLLTDTEKRERNVRIRTALKTITETVSLHKDHAKELITMCGFADVEQQHNNPKKY